MHKTALSIDIGGTKVYCAKVCENGEILNQVEKYKTPKKLDEIIALLKEIISKYEESVDIITIATAGAVNNENTKVLGSTGNLVKGYNTIDFQMLSKRPVFIENDANCAGWAEYVLGSAKGYQNSITITLGTGVGGGFIINGKLLKGKSGSAGEVHFKMSTEKKRLCGCGAYDCWEIYASGKGLVLTAKELLGRDLTSYEIVEGAKTNNDLKKVIEKWQEYVIMGLIGLSNIFDPDCIVLSGSMEQFIDTEFVQEKVNNEIVTVPVKILHAGCQNYSGLVGAALLGLIQIAKDV